MAAWGWMAQVEPENDRCEFDCRVTECRFDQWANCENRIRRMNAVLNGAEPPAKA